MKKIGIIGAMEEEIAQLAEQMETEDTITAAGMTFRAGSLCGQQIVLVRSGVGKVNAAICTQILADRFSVDAVINTGIAGGIMKGLKIGDIVLSTDAVHHDVHAEAFDYAPGQIPQMDIFAFPADERLADLAERVNREINPEVRTWRGRILSGDQFISSNEVKHQLRETYQGACAEMEGAAIAQAAYLNRIPFLIVRAISDNADDQASVDYDTFEKQAIRHSVNLVCGMLQAMGKER